MPPPAGLDCVCIDNGVCVQIERRDPAAAPPAATAGGTDDSPAGGPLEVRLQFGEVFATDIQPATTNSVSKEAASLLSSAAREAGLIDGAWLLDAKPNCVMLQPGTQRTFSALACAGANASMRRRHAFLVQTTTCGVLCSTPSFASSSGRNASQHTSRLEALGARQSRRQSLQMNVEDVDATDASFGGSDDGLLPSQEALVFPMDGPEFPNDHVPMLTLSVTVPPTPPAAAMSAAAWLHRQQAYIAKQLEAWSAGLPVPCPARDAEPTDTKTGITVALQADAVQFVHAKRFEDELKAAVEVTQVRWAAMWHCRDMLTMCGGVCCPLQAALARNRHVWVTSALLRERRYVFDKIKCHLTRSTVRVLFLYVQP